MAALLKKTVTSIHGHHVLFKESWWCSKAISSALAEGREIFRLAGIPLLHDKRVARLAAERVARLERLIKSLTGVAGSGAELAQATRQLAIASAEWPI